MSTGMSVVIIFAIIYIYNVISGLYNKLPEKAVERVSIAIIVIGLIYGVIKGDIVLIIFCCFGLVACVAYKMLK